VIVTSETLQERADDESLFELLNIYLEANRPGASSEERQRAQRLLQANPQLQPYVDCVESLERLAPRGELSAAEQGESDGGEPPLAATILSDSAEDLARSGSPGGSSSLFRTLPADFGGYELLAEIGRGGMGVVYRARHKSLNAPVAVKMIRSSQWSSDDEIRRFYQEARAAAGLSHAHIIKVHDVGELDGLHYLTMDLIEGPNLAELVREGAFEADRAAEIVVAIARAVHYLHTKGIVHRDLKPSNILLSKEGTPYVTDFGLAKVNTTEGDHTSTGTIIGTPCYMSPEQAWGRPSEVTTRSDVYSLGAILYELISGRPPFREDNPLDVLLRVRESEPLPPSRWNKRVPYDLEQICIRCLEKDPTRRYPSAEALADDLDRFLQREPLTLPSVSVSHRLMRWARREPGLMSRAVGLLVAAVIEQGHYVFDDVHPVNHWPVMMVIAAWALVSWVCQVLLNRGEAAEKIPFVWAAADALFFTWLIYLAAEPREILLVGYPLLIVAAGFWIRVRLVWFMTAVCLASFVTVYFQASDLEWPPHYPFLIGGIIALVGTFVALQVHRLRVLNRYFERHQ
jgi:serine/threonine-protein kinase